MSTSTLVPAPPLEAGEGLVRRLFGAVADTVAVVSTLGRSGAGFERRGMTVTSYCSVSDTPPLLLVCLNRGASTVPFVLDRKAFVLNVLPADAAPVADSFAGGRPPGERFGAGDWDDVDGLPVLRRAIAWGRCEVVEVVDGGDHVIVVGLLNRAHRGLGVPLIRYQHGYAGLESDPPRA